MKTILAVDDSATMREMVAFVLESAGYRVIEAEDGAQGLDRATSTSVDLFITDAEHWGCIYALRTGPGDWNTKLVTDCKRIFRRVEGGRVLHMGKPIPTPEEEDFFRALGQPWVEPWDRAPERIRIDAAIANGVRP